ncbi:RHS repeat protein [Streptomyces doebereineriae]|uniref:RHS repeat-associated core domain-containing protein n=1 Tax=Streptomyces doebereineriae TaxID=3075528 RepID=A0ABU2VGD9_9ACTN|nr:RHS repeat-associated core domain-containing protein [Streptomyces sp. DSM 41640]MDT0484639.1 RHS repeat-associated core domain-containing protein [Streptomyces sp. DSM 41640]
MEGSSTTGYIYDADGSLLIRRNTTGETVLYPGATEVHLDTSTSTIKYWAQRYYSARSAAIAVRSNKSGTSTLSYLAADHDGTSSLALDATTQAITKRYTTPFGAFRTGGTGTWPDDKTFLGKRRDSSSGLTHIGAREYDPVLARFISVDPLLETDKPQTLNGYTYSATATFSDPTGEGLAIGIARLDRVMANAPTVMKAWVDAGCKEAVVEHGTRLGIDVEGVQARDSGDHVVDLKQSPAGQVFDFNPEEGVGLAGVNPGEGTACCAANSP